MLRPPSWDESSRIVSEKKTKNQNPHSRCWSPCPGWACAWWAWRNLWRRCRCWCWDACRPIQWTGRSSWQKRKSWESQRVEGWTQFWGSSSLFLRVRENTAGDRLRCIRDKSQNWQLGFNHIQWPLMRSSIHWSTHSEKEFWIRREFRKSRGWRDGTLIASFTHRESLRGEKKNFDTKNQKYSEESVEPRKYLKPFKRFLGGKLQVLPDCAAVQSFKFPKSLIKRS